MFKKATALILLMASLALTQSGRGSLASGEATPQHVRGIVRLEFPQYSSRPCRPQFLQGKVRLTVGVTEEGRVYSVHVKSSEVKILADDAQKNVWLWVFTQASEKTDEEILYEYRLMARRDSHPCTYVLLDSPHHIIIESEKPEVENSASTNEKRAH